MRFVCTILTVLLLSTAAFAEPMSVTTFVGSDGGPGYRDGVGNAARFYTPIAVAVDASGNIVVADISAHTIRHVTPLGVVTTLAGVAGEPDSTDGRGGAARLSSPHAVAFDAAGTIYVADLTLRKISPSGDVTTLVSSIPWASDITVDSGGNIFLADFGGDTIRKVTPDGSMTIFVSTADAPGGLTIDSSNNLYFTTGTGGIYKCTPLGVITPIATVTLPSGLDVDSSGNLYVAASQQILKVTPGGTVTVIAGSNWHGPEDGPGTDARFFHPRGVALSPDESLLYVADRLNNSIRKITLPESVVTTFAGQPTQSGTTDSTGLDARFSHPTDVVPAPDGNLYVVENSRVRKITAAGVTSTLAGGTWGNADGVGTSAQFGQLERIVVGYEGNNWVLYVTDRENGSVRRITPAGVVTTVATGISGALGLAIAADGDMYVSEFYSHAIKKIDMPSGTVTVFAGASGVSGSTNATGTAARFQNPAGLAIDNSGNLIVADNGNKLIRQIALSTAEVTTLAGNGQFGNDDGTGTNASVESPMEIHAVGNDLYVTSSRTVRRIGPGGVVTTLANIGTRSIHRDGTGELASFASPAGMGGDSSTNLYICDADGNNIRKARVPGIADVATVSNNTPLPQTLVQFDTGPDTATTWTWSIERRPTGSTAELSSSTIRNPTFTPDVEDLYTFVLRAEGPNGVRYSTVSLMATTCPDPLTAVVASTGTTGLCATAYGGTATVSTTGGMGIGAYQWGYRMTSGGTITPIESGTSSMYNMDGLHFRGTGTRYLVVTVTPICGVVTVSNELAIEVTAAPDTTISAGSGVFANSTQNFASVADAGMGASYTWGITNGTITAGQGTRSIAYTAGGSGTVALTVTVARNGCAPGGNANVPIQARPAGATMLYVVTPCRVVDTRNTTAIANGETRNVLFAGVCGIPSDASAVVTNVTAVSPSTDGWLALWPAGTVWGGTSTMNYRTGRTRANNGIVPLANDGYVSVLNGGGSQHVIIDVTGYFR